MERTNTNSSRTYPKEVMKAKPVRVELEYDFIENQRRRDDLERI